MSRRGIIGFIAANPEDVFQQRMLEGIVDQCRKYGYDCAVYSPLVKVDLFFKEYLDGELNILELINFDKLDGVIVAAFSLIEGQTEEGRPMWVKDYVADLLKSKCRCPVISLGLPINDYPVLCTDDFASLEEITDHLIEEHGCKDIYFLSGMKGNTAADDRYNGYKASMEKHGYTVTEDMIHYGNFWYPSGEHLADKIISGEIPKPDAVVCANDYMAIGLINRLAENGIKVPEDVKVTGFDAVIETVMNKITVTSFLPAAAPTAAEAVNMIVKMRNPDAEIIPVTKGSSGIKKCASCGCHEDLQYIKNRLLKTINADAGHESFRLTGSFDINDLLDSYMFENITSTESISACLAQIADAAKLLRPFEKYYLCLEEYWKEPDRCTVKGYPETMKISVEADGTGKLGYYSEVTSTVNTDRFFDTSLMLPALYEERDHSCVFFFAPVHFRESTMGYSVLQCVAGERLIDSVFRNWLRNVDNALEMIRAQKQLTKYSEIDVMTGLLNRRGMESMLLELIDRASFGDSWLVFVIDMDGLKYINDTYGHNEGDYGIRAVSSAVRQISKSSEICVRAGGDEFYVIGLGEYHNVDAIIRIEKFKEALAEENKVNKPYEISASIGFCCIPYKKGDDVADLINLADSRMYQNKLERKKAR